jgi:hypothetical protein
LLTLRQNLLFWAARLPAGRQPLAAHNGGDARADEVLD